MARKIKEISPLEHCSTVREYEMSPLWKSKSQRLLEDKKCVCEICGRERWHFQPRNKKWKKRRFAVHHKTYKNVPNEKDEDLSTLCWTCHDLCHLILRLEGVGTIYKELAEIVRKYFTYDKLTSFNKW